MLPCLCLVPGKVRVETHLKVICKSYLYLYSEVIGGLGKYVAFFDSKMTLAMETLLEVVFFISCWP